MGSIILLIIGAIITGFIWYESFFKKTEIKQKEDISIFYALRFGNLNNRLK